MIDNYITFRLYVPIGIMTLLIVMLLFHRNHVHTLENIYEEITADKKILNIRFMETYHLIKEIMSGKISFCKIKSNRDKLLKVDIGIDNRKISFISRPKEYKTITGTTSYYQSPHLI